VFVVPLPILTQVVLELSCKTTCVKITEKVTGEWRLRSARECQLERRLWSALVPEASRAEGLLARLPWPAF
jgi:hypothetical protein